MIESFSDKETQKIFKGEQSRKLPLDVQVRALVKLVQLEKSESLDQLKVPVPNHLEALHRELKGFYGIRINKQWRLIFQWKNGHARNVRIIDYH